MRLTLRTLLAYMDDILEPSQAKEIGARVAENTVASSLVQRIRDVTRRRRVASPDLTGPGSAPGPNLIAEYLDNTLEPSAVADVEKVCLDSDTHLAEVAACHQILTIVLGEPVVVRPELRERMYALGAPADGQPIDASSILAAAPSAAPPIVPPPPRPVVPDYLKRPPLLKRVGPWIALCLILGVWVGFLAFDLRPAFLSRFFPAAGPHPDEVADSSVAAAAAVPATTIQQGRVRPESSPAQPSVSQQELDAREAQLAESLALDEALDPAFAPDVEGSLPEESGDDSIASATSPDQAMAVGGEAGVEEAGDAEETSEPAAGDVAVTAKSTEESAAAAEEAPPAAPSPQVMYTSTEGVLLFRGKGEQNWTVLPRRAFLHTGEEVACPEPFTAELTLIPNGSQAPALYVTLAGGSRIRLLSPRKDSVVEFELNRGRLGLARPSGEEMTPQVGVTVAGNRTSFSLEKDGTRCGLLVRLPQPSGPPPFEQAPYTQGGLFVVEGKVTVRQPDGTVIDGEAAPETLEWTNPADRFAVLRVIPNWLDSESKPLASVRAAARSFEPEFTLNQSVRHSIAPVVEDRRPQMARLAAETLALVDDVPDLVQALSSAHEEARLAAIVGLREWVLQSPENADVLVEEVARGFRSDEAPLITQLLWGLTPEEARQEGPSRQVVESMRSMNIAIRELAFYQARMLTGKDFGYRPLNPENQREAALSRWEDHIKRNEGLIAQ